MNDDRKFLGTKNVLLNLLKLGLPSILIQMYLSISTLTFTKYIKKLKETHCWESKVSSFVGSIPQMLRLLSYGNNFKKYIPRENWEGIEREKLINCLNSILEVEKINLMLSYQGPPIQKMRLYKFHKKVPEGYRSFLNSVNPFNENNWNKEENLWKNFLESIENGNEIHLDIKFQKDWSQAIVDKIIDYLSTAVRNDIKPVFGFDVCEKIDKALLPELSERESHFLKMLFGLNQSKLTVAEIGENFGLAKNRVIQIKDRAIRSCRSKNNFHLIFDNYIEIPDFIQTTINNLHKVSDLDISVRVSNILKSMDIEYLEELSKYTKSDLLKHRSMSMRGMIEINETMEACGISFCK